MTRPPLPAWVEHARRALERTVPPGYAVGVCWRPRLDRADFSVIGPPKSDRWSWRPNWSR